MIKLKFDTSGLKKFTNKIGDKISDYEQGKETYMKDISRKTEVTIFENIRKNVYAPQFEPKVYEWTYNLMEAEAVASYLAGNKAVIYMNDEWLESQEEAQLPMTSEKGFDPEVHGLGTPRLSYSERVEEGYFYHNLGQDFTVANKPRYYMAETYNDMINAMRMDSDSKPTKIISRLVKGWSR